MSHYKALYARFPNDFQTTNWKEGRQISCLVSTEQKIVTSIDSVQIEKSHSEKPMGAIIDKKLSFEEHIKTLCGKARSKPSALSSVVRFMNLDKRKNTNEVFKANKFF